MNRDLLCINWNGQMLTPEQKLVLRNVAARHLRLRKKRAVINFKHELCEGQIKITSEGTMGTFSGTFFHADLGTINGVPWNMDFMLPRGSERVLIDDGSIITIESYTSTSVERKVVNHHQADISKRPTVH